MRLVLDWPLDLRDWERVLPRPMRAVSTFCVSGVVGRWKLTRAGTRSAKRRAGSGRVGIST